MRNNIAKLSRVDLLTHMITKIPLFTLFFLGCVATGLGDIQDPPSADYGPVRKLGHGISNVLFGWSELPVTIGSINTREGNAAAASYGVVRGTERAFVRFGVGLYEVILWPIPSYKHSYYPVLGSKIRGLHDGYSEFPPEPGNESKYPYVREY